jgi:putative DNA primase/helicase
VFVCEGWATGVTIHEATGCAVAVAFYAGNLRRVTLTMRERYPGKLVLAPDNDLKTRGNPGMTQGFEIAEEFDVPLAIPPFKDKSEGSDWNDYAVLHDIEATAEAIYSAVEKWEEKALLERERTWPVWVDVTEKGKPQPTEDNLEVLLRHQGITLRYNEVAKEAKMAIPGTKYSRDGEAAAALAHVFSLCAKFGLPDVHIAEYLSGIAFKRAYNPVRDWILSKTWDGEDRLEALYGTLRAEGGFSEDFKRLILRRWLVSCAAAVFEEEFRNRGVLVLQGEQSLGKTAWLESLVPQFSEFFTSSPNMDVRSRDDVKRVLGYWIVELGELEGVLRLDMPRLKAFLTLRKDEMRLPYGHGMTKYQRRTVFCASVNQFHFLNDPTGNSRWWVIPCVALDYRRKIDIQQLWAQVYGLYRAGERWYFDRAEDDELARSNWTFEQPDEIEDLIKAGFDWEHFEEELDLNRCEYVTATEVLKLCKVEQPTKNQAMKAGEILRSLTKRPAARKEGGKRCYLVPRKLN